MAHFGQEFRNRFPLRRAVGKFGFVAISAVAGFLGGQFASSSEVVRADKPAFPVVPIATRQPAAITSATASDLSTTTISPVRIVDTRTGSFSYGGTKVPWGPGETRSVVAAGLANIPADALGVIVNVTALNATSDNSFITIFPSGEVRPEVSTLNPSPIQVVFNSATILLGGGSFDIFNYSGNVDLIIDVTAYMTCALADDVGRLQTGEFLPPLKGIHGVQFGIDPSLFSDWGNYAASDPTGFFGSPVPEGRFSESAKVAMEFAIDPIRTAGVRVCFRINSTTEGMIEESETCATNTTPQVVNGIVFLTTPKVPLPTGTLSMFARVVETPANGSCQMFACAAIIKYFGFRVFDS